MNEIWANRLIAGTKIWSDVPAARRDAVQAVLKKRVENGSIAPELYEEITWETYSKEG